MSPASSPRTTHSAPASREPDVWRAAARALLAAEVAPADVVWLAEGDAGSLFAAPPPPPVVAPTARVPARFVALAEDVVLHHEPGGHALLYRVLWRLVHGEPGLLDDAADADIRALGLRARQVRRALHDMHAFVRFRQVDDAFVAWYDPAHHVVLRAAPFFVERFAAMRWSILTPHVSLVWDGAALTVGPGVPRSQAPAADELEDLWRAYYAATFNPARANPALMRKKIPVRHRGDMPELEVVPELLGGAAQRLDTMAARAAHVPAGSLAEMRVAAASCTACDLCGPATQTVFGEGPADAALVLVGEQPGDQEDRAGRPFVGPAGEVLDAALARAGIDRATLYVTNAVKHFRFLPRGKKRIHQRPTADQIRACRPWVAAELGAVRPRVVVCLGSVAVRSLVGSQVRLSEQRGRPLETRWADHLVATHHPAAILRVDPADRARYEDELATDLALAARLLQR